MVYLRWCRVACWIAAVSLAGRDAGPIDDFHDHDLFPAFGRISGLIRVPTILMSTSGL